jgi:hypothetical protein
MPLVLGPSVTGPEGLIIDPTSEDATNAQLNINDGASYVLLAHDYPEPDLDPIYASSADTEGDIPISVRPKNRVLSITVNIYGSTALDLDQKIGVLSQKVGKLNREGGTLKRTTPSGLVIVFDVLPESSMPSVTFDKTYQSRQKTTVSLRFTCKPYGRGPESSGQAFGPSTGDVSVVLSGITGDAPALARAVLTEGSSHDQWHCHWGVRSRYYDATASAALGFEAESCTLLGGATVVTVTGSSGGGTNNAVRQQTLLTDWLAMLSFQATGGGAYKSHVGDYEVFARLYRPSTNTGSVSVALEWAEGDFSKVTRNDAVTFAADERENDFTIARLGQVHLSKAKLGTQRWDGRIIALSTVTGDAVFADRVWLRPISEGAGEVTVSTLSPAPTSLLARDEFTAITAGTVLHARPAPLGGNWATSGSATDFTAADAPTASDETMARTTISDVSRRDAILGSTNYTDTEVQVDVKIPSGGFITSGGVRARYTDASHYVYFDISNGVPQVGQVNGFGTILVSKGPLTAAAATAWLTLRLIVYASGTGYAAVIARDTGATLWQTTFSSPDMAPAAALASGKPGFSDLNSSATAASRYYDNFRHYVPTPPEAALFSGRQAQIRYDGYIRQDSGGTVWGEKTVDGDYLLLPCAGREGRSTELQLRVSRNDPATGTDPALDSVSGTVYYTPRYRNVPT